MPLYFSCKNNFFLKYKYVEEHLYKNKLFFKKKKKREVRFINMRFFLSILIIYLKI